MRLKLAGTFGHRGVSPTRHDLLERTMSLRRKLSPGFSRAVNYLLRSRAGVRHATSAPSTPDAATAMEKLDAALNNMSHGPCMFGPDNRLLLWNGRHVKMCRLAPDRLRVGRTLDEMLQARKAAP